MGKRYALPRGTYYLGDPAILIRKKDAGMDFSEAMWEKVYQDESVFKQVEVSGIVLYVLKAKHGDGIYDGLPTDSGAFILIDRAELGNLDIFKPRTEEKGFKWITLDSDGWVMEEDGICVFSFGYRLNTNA